MRLLITVICLLFTNHVFGQNITGLWQAGDTLVSSNYQQHYIFSAGNKFVYKPSRYDGLQRVLSIGGHYAVVRKTLYLTPEYTVENREGHLERSHITTLNDSWSVEGGQVKTYKIAKPIREAIQFEFIKRKKGLCILLDARPYYKIKVPAN